MKSHYDMKLLALILALRKRLEVIRTIIIDCKQCQNHCQHLCHCHLTLICLFHVTCSRNKDQINLVRQQLLESTRVSENLRKELNVYEKLYKLSLEGRNVEVQTEGMYPICLSPDVIRGSSLLLLFT